MLQRKHGQMAILVAGILGVLALAAQADSAQAPPVAQRVVRPSKAELMTRCQQQPACRAKLDVAQKDRAMVRSGVSVYLTPQNLYVETPNSWLRLIVVELDYTGSIWLKSKYESREPSTHYNPYVQVHFKAPVSGWYIIAVRAGSADAKLRRGMAGPIIGNWGVGSVPCAGDRCDYVTTEYLQAGDHTFVFYAIRSTYQFYSVSIESYP